MDDEQTTAELAAKRSLAFPVGYGADAPAIVALTGAFVNPDPMFLQFTGFVLDPAGNVVVSVYSSGAIGRPRPRRRHRPRPLPARAPARRKRRQLTAVHDRAGLSSSRYPSAARTAHSLHLASNIIL